MSHFRLLSFATIGIGGCFYNTFSAYKSKTTSIFKVNAQPQCPGDDFEGSHLSSFIKSDVNNSFAPTQPLTSTPAISRRWSHGPRGPEQRPRPPIPPMIKFIKNKVFHIQRCNEHEIPHWTLEYIQKNKFSDKAKDQECPENFLDSCSSDVSFRIGDVPNFETYCCRDLDPCLFQTVPPRGDKVVYPDTRVWQDFYDYVRLLSERFNMYICSGPVTEIDPESMVEFRSHFYKVILLALPDGSYEMECYIFPTKPGRSMRAVLNEYRTSKMGLQFRLQYNLFPDIERKKMKDMNPCLGCCLLS